MRNLKGQEGFPQIKDITEYDEHDMIVMQQLGDNLRTLKEKYDGRLSLKSCLQILHQVVISKNMIVVYR